MNPGAANKKAASSILARLNPKLFCPKFTYIHICYE